MRNICERKIGEERLWKTTYMETTGGIWAGYDLSILIFDKQSLNIRKKTCLTRRWGPLQDTFLYFFY